MNNDRKLINSKIASLPNGGDKNRATNLYRNMLSNKNNNAKSQALTDLNAIFVKHGKGSFFNNDGYRVGGKRRRRHTLRKKRTVHKTRRHRR
jgi:hypothetical protein